jgi:hypothetical protein
MTKPKDWPHPVIKDDVWPCCVLNPLDRRGYIREHWGEIDALCRLNSLPFNATGEVIQRDSVWRVREFTWQMDAILFWDRFEGRWLRGTEFHYPERPANLPYLKPLENWPKFDPRNTRWVLKDFDV